jgi:hypothetical protein
MKLKGCLAGILGFGIIAAFVVGILFVIFSSFTSSPVYIEALKAARADSRVVESLGEPIQPGMFVTGSLEEQGISGDANLTIPIPGSRKSGTLYASARKGNGVWQFYTLAVQVDGQDQLIPLKR